MMRIGISQVLALLCLSGLSFALRAQEVSCASVACPFEDVSLAPEARAADLVQRMTTEEKVSQTLDHARAIPRLGIPEYHWWNEGLHGVARNGFATVFPQAIAIAATWDAPLVRQVGNVIATEARAKHNEAVADHRFGTYTGLTFWSPNINIFRDPRWGRGQETYGEDPFLTATTGVAFIRGLQGNDPNHFTVIATPKHFAVHSGPEPLRHQFNVNPSAFDLEDTYLPAFRAAITEGHADSIMCAYNAVDGDPACASTMLLQQYLRDAWHFKGYVVSDCDAVGDVQRGHHYAADAAHAAAASLKAGTDLDCGSTFGALGDALRQGLITQAELDNAVVRLFTARFRLGMFDPAGRSALNKLSGADVNTTSNRQAALQVARESIVLLENKGNILPLTKPMRIAVVGPTADLQQAVEGNYIGTAFAPVLPLQGMRKQFGAQNILYSQGSPLVDGMAVPIPSTAFHQAGDGAANGLKAEYFASPDFSGSPQLQRIDDRINFNWDSVAPAAGLPVRNFSVRWTGVVTFPTQGNYTLHFRGIPRVKSAPSVTGESKQSVTSPRVAVRVFLDDHLVLDSTGGQSSFQVSNTSAAAHAIRIEYSRVNNDRYVSLEWIPPAGALLQGAMEAAKASDVVVAFVGLSPDLEGEEMNLHAPGFESGDRTSIDLPASQEHLLEQLKATGKPLIVVLTSGSSLATNWAKANADALLQAWYDGEEAGTAIAETIAGLNNPSGRLPVTFYRSLADLPAFDDYSMANRTYRYFEGEALYPFGYGLSYSSFTYDSPLLARPAVQAGEDVEVKTRVHNAGTRAGDEVVQIYVQSPVALRGAHPFLAGYQRVHLEAGESAVVSIVIHPAQLSRVDGLGVRTVAPGSYRLFAGGQQPRSGSASAALVVNGSVVLPK